MNMKRNKLKIVIIGYGRFGKLFYKMLLPYGDVFVIEKKKIKRKSVTQINCKDIGMADWVIPAVPISELEKVLKKIGPSLSSGTLVMDVCSVKANPIKWLKKYLSKNIEILGTHPMFGPDSAKTGLQGLQIILCPIRISSKNLNKIKTIFKKLKLKIIEATPENHDKQAAISLSLVHFIGRGLNSIKIKKQEISSLGFERLLTVNETVTNDTWQLFYDMHKYNPYAEGERKKYIKALKKLENKLKV